MLKLKGKKEYVYVCLRERGREKGRYREKETEIREIKREIEELKDTESKCLRCKNLQVTTIKLFTKLILPSATNPFK